jgi:hypothetical protein
MTPDQIIAIVGDVASFTAAMAAMAAAWGTFLTVKQVQRQTVASYRPELAFAAVLFTGRSEKEPIPYYWITGRSVEEADQEDIATDHRKRNDAYYHPSINLYNIGLGAAARIQLAWRFPIEGFVDEINKLAQRALVPAFFEYKPEVLQFKSDIWPNSQHISIWKNQKTRDIDYLLPESTQKSETLVEIPAAITDLVSAYLYFSVIQKRDDGNIEIHIPPLHASITYRDIGGNHYDASFDLDFQVVSIRGFKDALPTTITLWLNPKKTG